MANPDQMLAGDVTDDPDRELEVELNIRRTCLPRDERTYEIIAISLYKADLVQLDRAVDKCKQAGMARMSRSQLLRIALKRLDMAKLLREIARLR